MLPGIFCFSSQSVAALENSRSIFEEPRTEMGAIAQADARPSVDRLNLGDLDGSDAPLSIEPSSLQPPTEPLLILPDPIPVPSDPVPVPASDRSPIRESSDQDNPVAQREAPDAPPRSIPSDLYGSEPYSPNRSEASSSGFLDAPVSQVLPAPLFDDPLFDDPLFDDDLPPPLPPRDELLRPVEPDAPEDPSLDNLDRIVVERFEFVGNTAFSDADLEEVTQPYTNRPITLDELYEARSAVTQLYLDAGYVTSGAFIPPQPIQAGVVLMELVEGRLEGIEVRNNQRLGDRYFSRRIALGADSPLNVNDLLERLQLLQLDPRIQTLTAELSAGPELGTSVLILDVLEADTFNIIGTLDNRRSPSVGEFRQRLEISELNVGRAGETLNLNYAHTSGSDALEGRFRVFLNPQGGTLELNTGVGMAEVIERPFNQLQVESESNFIDLTYRQPLFQTLNEELAVGITASRQQTRSILDLPANVGGPFPLTVGGADENGYTRVVALRLFQEWLRRSSQDVFAVRSQFSLGLDALDATVNQGRPDSRFLAWRGQGQWLHLFAEDALLLVRSDIQLSTDSLVSLEQFGIGGQDTVRGY
ncbi:MAG TPA: POTRA domain-containing protein, partial [Candidatus Obscuribacterales bacterium]